MTKKWGCFGMKRNKVKEIFKVIIDFILFVLFFVSQTFLLILFAILMEIVTGKKILPW